MERKSKGAKMTKSVEGQSLWKTLWDYDPNALIVVNPSLLVTLVNPAFCKMFNITEENVVGYPAARVLDDADEFTKVWERNETRKPEPKEYTQHGLYVRKLIFPIREENVIACIMVDLTAEWQQQREFSRLKQATIGEITNVINNQMHTAQEIARLLGETSAESKISLHRLLKMIESDVI
jgi:PAS domain S-box-containing protein